MQQGIPQAHRVGALSASSWARAVYAMPSRNTDPHLTSTTNLPPRGSPIPRDLLGSRTTSPYPGALCLADYALNLQQSEVGGFPVTVWVTRPTTGAPAEHGWSYERRCTWHCACGGPCATSAAAVMWNTHCCFCSNCLLEGTDRDEASVKAMSLAAAFLAGAVEKGSLMGTSHAVMEAVIRTCREQSIENVICLHCQLLMAKHEAEDTAYHCNAMPSMKLCYNCYGPTLAFEDVGDTYTGQQRFCLRVESLRHKALILERAMDLLAATWGQRVSNSYLRSLRNEAEVFAAGQNQDVEMGLLGMIWGPDINRAPISSRRARVAHTSRLKGERS